MLSTAAALLAYKLYYGGFFIPRRPSLVAVANCCVRLSVVATCRRALLHLRLGCVVILDCVSTYLQVKNLVGKGIPVITHMLVDPTLKYCDGGSAYQGTYGHYIVTNVRGGAAELATALCARLHLHSLLRARCAPFLS